MPIPQGNEFIIGKGIDVITLPRKFEHIFNDFGTLSRRDCGVRPLRSSRCSRKQYPAGEPNAEQKRDERDDTLRTTSKDAYIDHLGGWSTSYCVRPGRGNELNKEAIMRNVAKTLQPAGQVNVRFFSKT